MSPSLPTLLCAMLSGGGVGERGCESLKKEQGGRSSLGLKPRPRVGALTGTRGYEVGLCLCSAAAPGGPGLVWGEAQLGG